VPATVRPSEPLHFPHRRLWRNWYTRGLQVPVGETLWRFESSQPHHRHFCEACDELGLRWTIAPQRAARIVYVSRKADVARLDEFVGPKT
jgi:hypothetical protein